jgi:hypothetical protein
MLIRILMIVASVLGVKTFANAATQPVKAGVAISKIRIIDMDHGSGTVDFEAIGRPGALRIHGKGIAPHGNLKISGSELTGNFLFDLSSLDTGMNLRNEHMKKKYLEVDKFPEAKLTITKLDLPKDFNIDHCEIDKAKFEGNLLLHGVEKPIKGDSKISCKTNQVNFSAGFDIVVEDYGIAIPSFAGVTMAKDVKVSIAATAPVQPYK